MTDKTPQISLLRLRIYRLMIRLGLERFIPKRDPYRDWSGPKKAAATSTAKLERFVVLLQHGMLSRVRITGSNRFELVSRH